MQWHPVLCGWRSCSRPCRDLWCDCTKDNIFVVEITDNSKHDQNVKVFFLFANTWNTHPFNPVVNASTAQKFIPKYQGLSLPYPVFILSATTLTKRLPSVCILSMAWTWNPQPHPSTKQNKTKHTLQFPPMSWHQMHQKDWSSQETQKAFNATNIVRNTNHARNSSQCFSVDTTKTHSTQTLFSLWQPSTGTILSKQSQGFVFLEQVFGIHSTALWFHSYLSVRKQYVSVDGLKSTKTSLNFGVLPKAPCWVRYYSFCIHHQSQASLKATLFIMKCLQTTHHSITLNHLTTT